MNIYELITLFQIHFDDTFDDIKKKYKNLIFKYHPDHSGKNTSSQFILIKDNFNIIREMFLNTGKNTTFKEVLLINIKKNNNKKSYFNKGYFEKNYFGKRNIKNDVLFKKIYFTNKKFYEFIIAFSSLFYFLSMYQNRFKYYSRISENSYEEKYSNFENKFNQISNYYSNDNNCKQFKKEIKLIISLCQNILNFYKSKMEKFNYSNPGIRKILINYAKIEDQIYELIIEIFFTQIKFYINNNKNILDKSNITTRLNESYMNILEFEKSINKYEQRHKIEILTKNNDIIDDNIYSSNNSKSNNNNTNNNNSNNYSNKNKNENKKRNDKTYNKICYNITTMKNILIYLKNIKENYIPFPFATEETKIWFENNL